MNNDIKKIQNNEVYDINSTIDAATALKMSDRLKQFKGLGAMIKSTLIEGIDEDYATIPGTKKPTLLQPGARKIAMLFGLVQEHKIIKCDVNYGINFFHYVVECKLVNQNGMVVASGLGSCSNKEKGKETAPDNTILKLAKKRAFIDAVLGVSTLSGVFTQDMEDFPQSRKTYQRTPTQTKLKIGTYPLPKEDKNITIKPDEVPLENKKLVINTTDGKIEIPHNKLVPTPTEEQSKQITSELEELIQNAINKNNDI